MALQNFDESRFLDDFWQLKPLLIQQALPAYECPLSGDDLAGLACEESVESRVIQHKAGNWQLEQGPFTPEDFSKLPAGGWTLLVQRVDHWIPEVAELLAHFNFLPRWRIDDIMVSYATDGGGVGPHFDNYDVFLLQGSGRREWCLGQHCSDDTPLRSESALKLLSDFQESSRHILEAGDILYIPPGTAHWGTAQGDDCITLSIGFRAPSGAEILSRWSDEASAQFVESERYRDLPATLKQGNTLGPEHVEALRELLLAKLDSKTLIKSFGGLVTEAADDFGGHVSPGVPNDYEEVFRALDARLTLYQDDNDCILFANGCALDCKLHDFPKLRIICDLLPGERLADELWFTIRQECADIAHFLLSTGAICGDSDEPEL